MSARPALPCLALPCAFLIVACTESEPAPPEAKSPPAELECSDDCDDDNPCTVDQCVRGVCVPAPITGGACSLPWVAAGSCWAGECRAACSTAAECEPRPCSSAVCVSSLCQYQASHEGAACSADGVLGTCSAGVCASGAAG